MRWQPSILTEKLNLKFTFDNSLITINDLKSYTGLYFEKNNKLYTYINKGTGPRIRLINKIDNIDILTYSKIKQPPHFDVPHPVEMIIMPSEKDYENGYFERYFAKRVNDINGLIVEINKAVSEKVKSHQLTSVLYKVVNIRWKLIGPELDTILGNSVSDFLGDFVKTSGTGQISNITYGVSSTNYRTVKKADEELMSGLLKKIMGNYTKFAKITK